MNDRRDGEHSPEELADTLERLFRDGRTNAIFAWSLTVVLVLVFFESLFDLDFAWLVFTSCIGCILLIPALAYRDWRTMLPWELVALALLPVLVRGLLRGTIGTFATYLSLAGLALLVIVELHMFTSLEVTQWFAVCLVVLTTLAAAALWTVVRWFADNLLATAYLVDNNTLMLEWFSVALAGIAAGFLFDGYFRRRDRRLRRSIHRFIGR